MRTLLAAVPELLDADLFWDALVRVRQDPSCEPIVAGAALGLLHGAGKTDAAMVAREGTGYLGAVGVEWNRRIEFLRGLLSSCREIAWQSPAVLAAVDQLMQSWTEEEFVRALPEMRLAFAELTPRETDKTGEAVAQLHGAPSIGEHRTGYVDVHELEVVGVAAFPWRARSGFRGITVLLWDTARKRWATWTEARSNSADPRFDPLKAFDGDCPWTGTISIRSLVQSRVKLTHAKQNAAGRLSSTRECKAQVLGPANLNEIDFGGYAFRSWASLRSHIGATSAIGLKQSDPASDWVVLTPARWANRTFDRIAQQFIWLIVDEAGMELPLALSYTDLTRLGIEHLESRDEPKPHSVSVVGRVLRDSAQLAIEPLALIPAPQSSFSPINLLVPAPGAKAPNTNATFAPSPEETSEIEDTEPDEETMHATSQWLRLARDYLTARAEAGGTVTAAERPGCVNPANKLIDAGLPVLGKALAQIDVGAPASAEKTLRAAYIARLHEQCRTPR